MPKIAQHLLHTAKISDEKANFMSKSYNLKNFFLQGVKERSRCTGGMHRLVDTCIGNKPAALPLFVRGVL